MPPLLAALQVGKGMNRDYWARFERFVQMLADSCTDVWIVTGPLYLPRPAPGGCYRMDHALLGGWPMPARILKAYF